MPTDGVEAYGKGRDWNVDLIPKFLMANGKVLSICPLGVHPLGVRPLSFQNFSVLRDIDLYKVQLLSSLTYFLPSFSLSSFEILT